MKNKTNERGTIITETSPIKVVLQTLSDGSTVYGLQVGTHVFDCLSEKCAVYAAHEIVEVLRRAVVNPDSLGCQW